MSEDVLCLVSCQTLNSTLQMTEVYHKTLIMIEVMYLLMANKE